MMYNAMRKAWWVPLLCVVWITGCTAVPAPLTATSPAPGPPSLALTGSAPGLVVTLLYPLQTTEVKMGQAVKFIARVTDPQGTPVTDAQLIITIHDDANGKAIGAVETTADREGTYRGGPWVVPHRISEGGRQLSAVARRGDAVGEVSGSLQIRYSISDILLNKYGFWLDAPTLRAIDPQLAGEQGDARDGFIRWGGQIPSQHVLPENWVEVHWRHGRYDLEDAEAVRRFMLEEIGSLGFTPIRSIGPIEPFQFKSWDAWRVGGRGQVKQNQVEWVVFYAPEADKTYLIGSIVTLPPVGIDAHAVLRESFEVHPEVHAAGVAPKPLPELLPGPELLAPPLGARFTGIDQAIVLKWHPVKDLAPDDYYQVSVDYNHNETNTVVVFSTRETQLALPERLYETPNCGVFNWQVNLMRQSSSETRAEPISHSSLYWYVEWRYPPGVERPFTVGCPNAQF